jgi:hypothetical protein
VVEVAVEAVEVRDLVVLQLQMVELVILDMPLVSTETDLQLTPTVVGECQVLEFSETEMVPVPAPGNQGQTH